jgi:hypothetical protein
MRTFVASLVLSLFLGGSAANAAPPCGEPGSPLTLFDTEADVVRVKVVPGSTQMADGGIGYKFEVLETLRGKTKVGAILDGGSGGPCARKLDEGAEYVLALGHANDAGVGRVNAGRNDQLPTSIALQTQIAKTELGDAKGRAGVAYRAATAKTATKEDLLSVFAYLAAKPDVVAALTPAQRRRLDQLFADGKKARPELATAWTKLITK